MAHSRRGGVLTFFAIILAVIAIEDFLKPFGLEGPDTGIVFFGNRLQGNAAYVGSLVGAFLLLYAIGIWRMRKFALYLACAYAVYVILNLVIFSLIHPAPKTHAEMTFDVIYSVMAIIGTSALAIVLWRRRADLG